jgi:hypothetical protein
MDIGNFYFINDQYFIDFPDSKLMNNKETLRGVVHNRPCYYTFKDNVTGVYWGIPISSQVSKYRVHYDRKVLRYGDCDTIHFGYVLGKEKAFLIQNMCPVIDEYINNIYIDNATSNPVIINPNLASELTRKARKVLGLQKSGQSLIFPDVLSIERALQLKLES